MGQPVYRFLEDFANDGPRQQPVALNIRPLAGERTPQPDQISRRLNEAHAIGRAEGEAMMRERMQRDVEQLAAECERKIEGIKRHFIANAADKLAIDLSCGLDEMVCVISDQIVAILLPVLAARLTEQGIKQFAWEVKAMFESAQAVSIELSGPDELVSRLITCLETEHDWKVGGKGPQIQRTTGSETELRVVHGCSMIESRLGEWLATIHKAAP